MTPSDLSILYDTYAARLTYFAFNILKDKESASDVVNRVFIKLWQGKVPAQDCSIAMLYTTVKNACIDYIRSQKRRRSKEVTTGIIPEVTDEQYDRFAIYSEYMSSIYQEVKHLPERQREIFIRTYFEGQQAPQIAKEMGITVSSVTTQRQRVIEKLKRVVKAGYIII